MKPQRRTTGDEQFTRLEVNRQIKDGHHRTLSRLAEGYSTRDKSGYKKRNWYHTLMHIP